MLPKTVGLCSVNEVNDIIANVGSMYGKLKDKLCLEKKN